MRSQPRSKQVVLVGRRIMGNDNLALGYLSTALEGSGFRVRVEYLNRGLDLNRIAAEIDARLEEIDALLGDVLDDQVRRYSPLAQAAAAAFARPSRGSSSPASPASTSAPST